MEKQQQAVNVNTLYIDLDGTLTFSDVLVESFLELIKKNPFMLLLLPCWLLRGKANFKYQIARRIKLRADLLPYNQALLNYLQEQKQQGRKLVLMSASSQLLVSEVARHLGLFDEAVGSTPHENFSGRLKLNRMRAMNPDSAFAYAGNAAIDLEVWQGSAGAILVNTGDYLSRRAAAATAVLEKFDNSFGSLHGRLKAMWKVMRPHQWLKNLLLLVPLMLSHQMGNTGLLLQALIGLASFSLCASSVYVLNDLLDLSADRQHHSKCHRPFAAGELSPQTGLVLSPLLLLQAFALALLLPPEFLTILALYYFGTCFYSLVLKQIELVDVITLATLYTLRIIAGAAAVSVLPSFWLLAFSMFLFMSLAFVKRYTELSYLREQGITHTAGRGYQAKDLDMMAFLGCSSGFMAVLVFALYINSDATLQQYRAPEILWFICPLLLYLISRIWLLAWRGEIDDDPVVFALQDGISQAVAFVAIVLLWMANLDWQMV